ncbi:2Fe-2S iron-sulfur cluster-binding protein [Streptomyces sp. NPDC006879]|uniref:2Fe-2S iron-sulfur cluster-binding protein n=1 Tax=Streptomyces sp. NPDC006879 TaxID=3364767 RepID=UPI00368E24C3
MSTNDNHQEPVWGGWQPVPHGGEYDSDATAFVKLPEEMLGATGSGEPLAAPGHGYVPPVITPLTPAASTDPSATGTWTIAAPMPSGEAGPWQEAATTAGHPSGPTAGNEDAWEAVSTSPADSGATAEWRFPEVVHPQPDPAATGQWTVPAAREDLQDESGEFTTSSLMQQWGHQAPATLPGGAAAPWATAEPTGAQAPAAPFAGAAAQAHLAPPQSAEAEGAGHAGPDTESHLHLGSDAAAGHPGLAPDSLSGHGAWAPAGSAQDAGRARHEAAEHAGLGEPGPDGYSTHEADALAGHFDGPATAGPAPAGYEDAPGSGHPGLRQGGSVGSGFPVPEAEAVEDHAPTAPGHAEERSRSGAGAAPEHGAPVGEQASSAPADSAWVVDAAEGRTGTDGTAPDPVQEPEAKSSPDPGGAHHENPHASYVLRVNGVDRPVTDAWIGESLLYVLRERLGLAGAKDGCSQGECGACAVQVDGRLVASCLVPAATTAGSEVRTVEGLAAGGEVSDVQRALACGGAVQCGFCIPGMAMTIHDLLEGNHAPTELETRQALCGNLCRCSGYRGALEAVRQVVAEREAGREGEAPPTEQQPPGTAPADARIPHQAPPGAGSVHHTHDGGMA